jgi:hypothetical protein
MADLATLETHALVLNRQIELIGKSVDSIRPGNRSRGSIDAALDAMAAFRQLADDFIAQATLCAVNRRNMPLVGEVEAVERAS